MKKQLLFIIPSLAAGGGEKSLINLLSQIDYDQYEVDVFLFAKKGVFLSFLPPQVSVLNHSVDFEHFSLPVHSAIWALAKRRRWKLVYNRLLYFLANRRMGNTAQKEQYAWKYLKQACPQLVKTYDAAIGFLEKSSTYFCVEKVNAKQKIGWVHIDYNEMGMDATYDHTYFKEMSTIVTVSHECARVFIEQFPSLKYKVKVIHNIVSPTIIYEMSRQNIPLQKQMLTLLTIGRLHPQKGLDMAIEACSRLVRKGMKLKWYIIGEGQERIKLERLIRIHQLEEHFILLGQQANPYPWLDVADIYVQPSRFEGKAIAIDEAKIMHKPIVVTNYTTAKDQIIDRVTGLIVDLNVDGIEKGISLLMKDDALRKQLTVNLSGHSYGTESEIDKFYQIV